MRPSPGQVKVDNVIDHAGRQQMSTVALFVTDSHYTKQWVMTGVHSGDIPGLPATGKPFRIRGCGVGRVDDNKIVELTEYWNTAAFLMQVCILPTPTA
jgi:steroid delta-isomerase-like uncharacterized protein